MDKSFQCLVAAVNFEHENDTTRALRSDNVDLIIILPERRAGFNF